MSSDKGKLDGVYYAPSTVIVVDKDGNEFMSNSVNIEAGEKLKFGSLDPDLDVPAVFEPEVAEAAPQTVVNLAEYSPTPASEPVYYQAVAEEGGIATEAGEAAAEAQQEEIDKADEGDETDTSGEDENLGDVSPTPASEPENVELLSDEESAPSDSDGDGVSDEAEKLAQAKSKPELIELAEEVGVDSSGTKAEIAERLIEADYEGKHRA